MIQAPGRLAGRLALMLAWKYEHVVSMAIAHNDDCKWRTHTAPRRYHCPYFRPLYRPARLYGPDVSDLVHIGLSTNYFHTLIALTTELLVLRTSVAQIVHP